MRDRMERLVILPFSAGCISHSSVAVSVQQPRSSKPDTNPSAKVCKGIQEEEEDKESLSSVNMKGSFRMLALPKPNISTGFHRLFKSFKSFSQLFGDCGIRDLPDGPKSFIVYLITQTKIVYKEEIEELEMEMEIGLPTDVKHVTHIGLDGSATTNPIKGFNNLISPEMLSLTPLSLRQFELAMASNDTDTPNFTVST